jgi:hypothetical protein
MHVGEDLEVVDVANVVARIDVNPDGHDSAMPAGSEAARCWVGAKWSRGVGVDMSRAASTSSADRPYHLIDLRFFFFLVDGRTGAKQWSFHGSVTHAV